MIIILGLIIRVAVLVVGVAGVLGNDGAHAVAHLSVLGYRRTGSAGTLFLADIVVGAAGLLGLSLLRADACRTSRRGSATRRGLRQSRRETAGASQERDELIGQGDTARAYAARRLGNGNGGLKKRSPAWAATGGADSATSGNGPLPHRPQNSQTRPPGSQPPTFQYARPAQA